eukprot:229249_1
MPPHRRNKCNCKRKKSKHPLITICIIGAILIFTLYIIVFIEIDGIDLYKILSRKSSIEQYNIFKEPANRQLKLSLEPITKEKISNEINSFDIHSDNYFKMFEYIHNTPFNNLSSKLQTRHLQELFRYNIMKEIHNKQKK